MRAFIRQDKWEEFKKDYVFYGFSLAPNPNYYVKSIARNLLLVVSRRKKELRLITPLGETPFMEAHKEKYTDLIENNFIEFKKGKFD